MPPCGKRAWPAGPAWAVLGFIGPAAAAGGGGQGTWWSYEYEYFHFECYVAIVLVVLAMLVDSVHHRLSHLAKGAHAWRGDQADAHREVHRESQVSLWEGLFGESVGELMVLGFVAMMVWAASRAGLFDTITAALSGYTTIALPGDSADYLHTVEDVHMQLFATMMLYISTMALTVRGTMHAEMLWEAADDHLASDRHWGDSSQKVMTGRSAVPRHVLNDFSRRRNAFFQSLEDWRGRWLQMDEELEPVFASLPEALTEVSTLKLNLASECEEHSLRTPVKDMIEDWFPFDEYLALECRFLVHNLAEVKTTTWVFIMLSKLLKAQLLRETRTAIATYGFDVVMMLMLIIVAAVSGWRIRYSYREQNDKNRQSHSSRPSRQPSKIWKMLLDQVRVNADHHINHPWLTALNLLQIVLFYMYFHIVRFTTLRQWWEEALERSIICAAIVLLGVPCLGFALGRAIPWLSLVLARADFMQERHLKWIRVLVEDHCTGRDIAYNAGHRLSVNLHKGITSPLFASASAPASFLEGALEEQVSEKRLSTSEKLVSVASEKHGSVTSPQHSGLNRLDLVTIMAARVAVAQERRLSQVSPVQQEALSPCDLPGCVSDD